MPILGMRPAASAERDFSSRAVAEGAIVPVYFEPRLIKVGLASDLSEKDIDQAADEATVGLDLAERERIEKSAAVINAVYGAPRGPRARHRPALGAREQRAKFIEAPGKAMIVGATR